MVLSDLRIQPRAGNCGTPNTKTGKEPHADRLNETCSPAKRIPLGNKGKMRSDKLRVLYENELLNLISKFNLVVLK